MEQKMKFELTGKDLEFCKKIKEIIKDSDGVSYPGWIHAITMLAYSMQMLVLRSLVKIKSEEGYDDICNDVETDIVEVCRIVSASVKEELAQLLDEDAKKEPNTNI